MGLGTGIGGGLHLVFKKVQECGGLYFENEDVEEEELHDLFT